MSKSTAIQGCSNGGDRREGGVIKLTEQVSCAVAIQGYSCGGDRHEGGVNILFEQMRNAVAEQGRSSGGNYMLKTTSNFLLALYIMF